jgi:hypothetical protein
MTDDWTDDELAAAVSAYLDMARAEAERHPYNKRRIYRELAARFGRTDKAFEFRMQNISAVLDESGMPWVPGLKPKPNVGTNVKPRIVALIKQLSQQTTKRSSEPEYKSKLPAMRSWLIEVARSGQVVTYRDFMDAFGVGFRNLRRAMDFLGHQAENLDEPIITALIVSSETGRCSEGLVKEFEVVDDEAERKRLYEFWSAAESNTALIRETSTATSLEIRAARFVSVEPRPQQAAFRRKVFLACGGKCVISGCDIVTALDAAHIHGRDWRKGHNSGHDGILLRKDLHALYDHGLLRVTERGSVELEASIASYYREFDGVSVEKVT